MKNLRTRLGIFAAMFMTMLAFSACGEKCEDTCQNGECNSTTATQKECVCYDGYYGDFCENAANQELDTTFTTTHCGNQHTFTVAPASDPLKFTIAGLGSAKITVTLIGNSNTTASDIYHLADVDVPRQALGGGEEIEGTGFYNRDDFLTFDYTIFDVSGNPGQVCTFYLGF